jgi:hypothetical protein
MTEHPGVRRYGYYDIRRDITWRQITAQELDIIQAARQACGVEPLVFESPMAAVTEALEREAFLEAANALREVLGMPYPGYGYTAVLEAAAQRLRAHGVSDD